MTTVLFEDINVGSCVSEVMVMVFDMLGGISNILEYRARGSASVIKGLRTAYLCCLELELRMYVLSTLLMVN